MKRILRRAMALALVLALAAAAGPMSALAEDAILIAEVGDKQYLGLNRLTGVLVRATEDLPAELVIPSEIQGYPVTAIDDKLFYGRESLVSVTIPGTVKTVGDQAFTSCRSLRTVSIANGVETIGKNAFRYCYSLTDVSLPSTLTTVESYLFDSCLALRSITVPEGVTAIGERAFSGCKNLSAVSLPDTVTSIGEYAFSDCTSLASVVLPKGLEGLSIALFNGCTALTSVSVPSSVRNVGKSAFGDCSSLARLVLPEGVYSIEDWAFNGCKSLTQLSLPDSVKVISADAFYGCDNVVFYVNAGSYSQVFASANNRPFVVGTLEDNQDDNGLNYAETPFTDDKDSSLSWARPYIRWAYAMGYMGSTSTTAQLFSPTMNVSRGQLVTMLYNMEGRPEAGSSTFTDLTMNYYRAPIAWAQANNIVSGVGGTLFAPEQSITREAFATMLYNYARYKGLDLSAAGDMSQFRDTDQISRYAGTAMSWAVGSGIISGKGNALLDPKGGATRAEAAVMLQKFSKLK